YAKLGLDWIPPELREARGEIALAREHRLPHLVEVKDIRGDLQMHTSATDGKGTIEDMAHAARALGYEYIAITDHSKRVTMALGLDAIGHPTGRLVGKREPYAFDFDALCRSCAATGCLLELNGHPERMDLPDTLAAAGKQHGVRFVLSTDSHQPGNLPFMKYAVY